MLQYKIPQNIGIEDKIVGPFSLRQLIILAVGGGISYVLFAISSRLYELNFIEYILIALPGIISVAAAMLKIHNVTFAKYILLMLEFAIKPKKRMWDHRGISALVAPDLTEKKTTAKEGAAAERGRKGVNLSSLSAMLDSGGFENVEQVKHEDIDKVDDDDLITEAYFGHKKKESSTENMYWRTREVQKKKLDILAKIKAPASAPAPIQTPPPPATVPALPVKPQEGPKTNEKKETVAEHLANVIKEARQNNEAKKPVVQPKAVSGQPKPEQMPSADAAAAPKRKRKRKRKPKASSQPVRPNAPINTTSRTEPLKVATKPEPAKPAPKPAPQPEKPKKPEKIENETSFSDLSGGDEIEINLD